MHETFKDRIRKRTVKWPTQRGFKLSDWDSAWNSLKMASSADEPIYRAGRIIHSILAEIRTARDTIYKELAPSVTNESLLRLYCAMSNRDRAIINKTQSIGPSTPANLSCLTTSNNMVGNEVTLQEVADGCVDGLRNAIHFCVARINDRTEMRAGSVPLAEMDFVTREAHLSQLYGLYEDLWHALVWSDYDFVHHITEDVYEIVQRKTDREVARLVSHLRKSRLAAQSAGVIVQSRITEWYAAEKYVLICGSGKRKTLRVRVMREADEHLQAINAHFHAEILFLRDEFPDDFFVQEYNKSGFCISDVLSVFRLLMLLSNQYFDRFPADDSFTKLKKLQEFCPSLKRQDLVRAIANASGLDYSKASKIIAFLTYSTKINDDLWCSPVLEPSPSEIILLVSALATPVVGRVVEHWLVKLDADLQAKGQRYEQSIVDQLNLKLSCNSLLSDFDCVNPRKLRIEKNEEEVDLLLRIGNTILIGEIKSIVATDSPISHYRTLETLEFAARQVKRKGQFIVENLEAVFKLLDWNFQAVSDYTILPVVVSSNRMHAGFGVLDVPVCDDKILYAYFENNTFPLFSTVSRGRAEHLVWLKLYSNLEEGQRNLNQYLRTPPQVHNQAYTFEYSRSIVPCISEKSYRVVHSRLMPREVSIHEIIRRVHPFPLETVPNIDERLRAVDVVI